MKKWILSVAGAAVLFSAGAGSAFASQASLSEAVDAVMGTPYKWGGTTAEGFDCSGFILYVFNQFDVKLSRTSESQSKEGIEVAQEDLQPGDLVFFNTSGSGVSHVGIYMGDGQFAHSSSSKGVKFNKLSEDYYSKRFVTARRVVDDTDVMQKMFPQ
ncbi:C40 family peptidase [Paenibacillus sp. GCM10027626]|uniref:C40 family peptidase n=1 Tax=Paenibacillus sp. GCM10027626 TaxID=3273411 RepID=UPI003630AFE0